MTQPCIQTLQTMVSRIKSLVVVFFNISWLSWQFVGDGKGREQEAEDLQGSLSLFGCLV